MAQTGYTPIQLYYSTTASAVPTAGNLNNGELAINITDGKLYYKNNSGVVTLLAGAGGAGIAAGSNTQIQFNSSGSFGASSNLTWDGSTFSTTGLTASGTVTLSGGTANGVTYLNGSKVLTSGSALTFDGTNLGLGVTPSAWSAYKAFQVGSNGSIANSGGTTLVGWNSYYDGTNYKYIVTGQASQMLISPSGAGGFAWYNAGSGTAGNNITFTQAMTLDASGNLGLGNTPSSTSASGYRALELGTSAGSGITAGNGDIYINENAYVNGGAWKYAATSVASGQYNISGGSHYWSTAASGTAGGTITWSERLRINNSGAWGLSGANYGTSGQVLTSQGSGSPPIWASGGGGSSQWTTNGSDIYYSTGNVGIGVTSPTTGTALQVNTSGKNLGISVGTSTTGIASLNFYSSTSPNRFGILSGIDGLLYYTGSVDIGSGTERMRIDTAGRVGIATTSATTNLARLQVTHDANTDRYGIYVPGNSYVGSGPSGTQYGGYFSANTSNAASSVIGVAGVITQTGAASTIYGVYGDGGGTASYIASGVYGIARQTDNGGPGQAFGGYFVVTTPNPSAGGGGGMIPVRAESQANKGSYTYAVWASTLAGPSTINGYYYEHAGSLQCRIKSNGGIDNYSGNNTNLSDRREKKDFAPAKSYLETICAIPVQTFKYIDQTDDLPTLGVVAQDVQAVAPELVAESNWARHDEEPRMRLSVYETDLIYALMKSIQELKVQFDEYKASHP